VSALLRKRTLQSRCRVRNSIHLAPGDRHQCALPGASCTSPAIVIAKSGTLLLGLSEATKAAPTLFADTGYRRSRALICAMDRHTAHYHRGVLRFASMNMGESLAHEGGSAVAIVYDSVG